VNLVGLLLLDDIAAVGLQVFGESMWVNESN
jgi:hypothetical protein